MKRVYYLLGHIIDTKRRWTMSTAPSMAQATILADEVFGMAQELARHVSCLISNVDDKIRVNVEGRTEAATYCDIEGTIFRITPYGVVAKPAKKRRHQSPSSLLGLEGLRDLSETAMKNAFYQMAQRQLDIYGPTV
jgi:hypothetical protein